MPKPRYVSTCHTRGNRPGADRAQDLARRIGSPSRSRNCAMYKTIVSVGSAATREANSGRGKPVRNSIGSWSAPLASTCRTSLSFLLSRSDAPETTTMRRAFGCMRRARSMVSRHHVGDDRRRVRWKSRGGFKDLAWPAGKHEPCARPKERAMPIEKLQCALADRDDHVESEVPNISWPEARSTPVRRPRPGSAAHRAARKSRRCAAPAPGPGSRA